MRDGETLIRNLYNAIRQNDDLWHSGILLIVYDEHGGLYDHVKPVPLPSPDGLSSVNPPFDFTMSGIRVPAVVVSPYIQRSTISSKIFDHTSIIATALKLFTDTWPTDALFSRAQAANTLEGFLDLTMSPRDEWPVFAKPVYGTKIPEVKAADTVQATLSDLQREAVEHAKSLNASLPQSKQIAVPADVSTQASKAGAFVKAVGNAAVSAHGCEGMKSGGLLLIALLATVSAHAESWTTTKSTCQHGFSKSYLPAQPEPAWRFHTLEECAIDLFTLDPVGPTMGSVGTGSGFGGGVHVKYKSDANHILALKAFTQFFLCCEWPVPHKSVPSNTRPSMVTRGSPWKLLCLPS